MKWMMQRIDDERSSDICKKIEEKSLREGGLKFPFSLGKYTYTEEDLKRGVNNSNYYSKTFHTNCRCHLVPLAESISIFEKKAIDPLDKLIIEEGVFAQKSSVELAIDETVSEDIKETFFSTRSSNTIKSIYNFFRDNVVKKFIKS